MYRKFPEKLFVQVFDEGTGEEFSTNFIASETAEQVFDEDLCVNDAGKRVAIYKLVDVQSMSKILHPPTYRIKKLKNEEST